MRVKLYRLFSCILIVCTIFSVATIKTLALSWDGSSSGGGGGGTPAGPNGYAVRTTGDNCLGYRFSVVDKHGNTKNGTVIDVFRNTSYGNMEYNSAYKFNTKYNKKQLINNQNKSFSTSKTTSGCIKETSMGFATTLPTPNSMHSWQSNHNNLNKVLNNLGITGGVGALVNGDKVLVEPLYDVRLQSIYHSLTTTEIAIYGKWILGSSSNGGSSSTSASWGFISSYTNRYYPNSLYTSDGQGLWTGVGSLSSRATFYDIINKGYGVGIAYTETKPDFSPTLSVNVCEAWPGAKGNRLSHYGISNGSSFGNFSYANGYPTKGNSIWFALNFPAESQTIRVRQSVRLQGGSWTTRIVNLSGGSSSSKWFDVSLSPTTVDNGRTSYIVEAKQDWIDGSNKILKYGAVKSFYIPIRPKINRYQVSMYDITGTQIARNGSAGISGAVYAGQRVYPKYTYTSENSWNSSNYLRGALYSWKNGAWNTVYSSNGGSDLYIDKQSINQNSPYERYSNLGLYTVPDNSANTNGSNRVPFKLWTHWASNMSNTTETTWIDIPIIKADVELKEILLIDENGYYITSNTLYGNQKVTPQYVYKNNTNCKIYVEGYNSDNSRISGIYAIPAYGEIYVNGKQRTVTDGQFFSVWGGVYLDGAGIRNTSMETNRDNNHWLRYWNVKSPLTIEVISPNSRYRENTQVITSFKIQNAASFNIIPSNNVTVRMSVYKGPILLYTALKADVVIPAYNENLVYFKWKVPSGLNNDYLTIKGEVLDNGSVADMQTISVRSEKLLDTQTPDTNYKEKRPSSWYYTESPTAYATSATWSEWVYSGGVFTKKTYGIGLSSSYSISITPDINSPSAQYINGEWNMKSGYGFSLYYYPSRVSISGTNYPSSTAYTAVQSAYATFPEFSYSMASSKYRTLELLSGAFRFKINAAANGDRLHFIPVWYPNGTRNYKISCYAYDFWTPAGMINARVNLNSFNITGSAYDDWYVGK